MSNLGKWQTWNDGSLRPYGDVTTYKIGAEFLADCALVEDWGAGRCFMSTLIPAARYWAIDGSPGPGIREVTDLLNCRSGVPGIFMRHVLEHNYTWAQILANAIDAADEKLCVVLFTPWADGPTFDLKPGDHPEIRVPDLSFNREDFLARFWSLDILVLENLKTQTQFGVEHVICATRKK